MTPDLVIFDCDGVLVDTEIVVNTAISQNLSRYGFQIAPSECLSLFTGGTMKGVMENLLEKEVPLPGHWLDEIYGEVFDTLRKGVDVIDGVVAVLDVLDTHDIPYCIASNGPDAKMEISLAPSGLLARFEGRIFSAHRYDTAKPDPELLNIAARSFGVAPDRAVMIDDNPAGVIAAQKAGMRAIGFDETGNAERLSRLGAEVIHHMKDLPPLLSL